MVFVTDLVVIITLVGAGRCASHVVAATEEATSVATVAPSPQAPVARLLSRLALVESTDPSATCMAIRQVIQSVAPTDDYFIFVYAKLTF